METYNSTSTFPGFGGNEFTGLHFQQGELREVQLSPARHGQINGEINDQINGQISQIIMPPDYIDIFLQPGDFYFGDRNTRIRTLLGSCISITVWHPQLLIGGMCHFLVPTRSHGSKEHLDGRYGDEALEMFLKAIRATGTRPADYQVKLFGGSNILRGREIKCVPEIHCADPITVSCKDISCRNRRSAILLVERHGFAVTGGSVGGSMPHNVLFDLWNGHVWIKRPPKDLVCHEDSCRT